MLTLRNQFHQAIDVVDVGPQSMRRNLAMNHLGSDVGVVGRDLTPTLGPAVAAHPDQADEAGAERLDALNLHRAANLPKTISGGRLAFSILAPSTLPLRPQWASCAA